MLVLIVVNGNLLRRHATNTVVRRIQDRGQDLRKVTLRSHGRHALVTGYRYARSVSEVWSALTRKADGDTLTPDPNRIEHALLNRSPKRPTARLSRADAGSTTSVLSSSSDRSLRADRGMEVERADAEVVHHPE